jgi:hypothetical protein
MSKVAIHILVSPSILEKLQAIAAQEMTSVSAVGRKAIARGLELDSPVRPKQQGGSDAVR